MQEEICSLLCPKGGKPKSVSGRWSWDNGSDTRQDISFTVTLTGGRGSEKWRASVGFQKATIWCDGFSVFWESYL